MLLSLFPPTQMERPNLTFKELIQEALDAAAGEMTAWDIITAIRRKHTYFRSGEGGGGEGRQTQPMSLCVCI